MKILQTKQKKIKIKMKKIKKIKRKMTVMIMIIFKRRPNWPLKNSNKLTNIFQTTLISQSIVETVIKTNKIIDLYIFFSFINI